MAIFSLASPADILRCASRVPSPRTSAQISSFSLASGTVNGSCPLECKDREHLRLLRRLEI